MDLSVLLNPEAILVLGGLFIVGLTGVIIAMAYFDDQSRSGRPGRDRRGRRRL